ncbi:LysR family transcriptional regulator [Streptomyces sp. NPDC055037]
MNEKVSARELLPALAQLAALTEEQSITKAAVRSGTSQATLTRAIQRWSGQLGIALVRPSGRGVQLTEEGRLLAQAAHQAVHEIDDALRRIRGEHEPSMTIGYLRSLGPTVVGELVSSYVHEYPDVHVAHRELSSAGVLDALDRQEIDLAVTSPKPPERFDWLPVGTQAIVLLVPNGHRLAAREAVELREIDGERLLALDARYHTRHIADALCAAAGIRPRIAIEADNLETIANYVAAGQGIAIVPADSTQRPRVTALPLADGAARRDFGLAWRPEAVGDYASALIEHARGLERRYPHWADIKG